MSAFATPTPSKISRYSRYGSWQVLSEAQFQRGLVTDTAPVALPAGAVVDASDYLFDRPGKIRKRGGTLIRSTMPGGFGMTGVAHVAYAPFSAGDKLVAVANTAAGAFHAFDATPATAVDIGPLGSYSSNKPIFYNDHLYILFGSSFTPGKAALITNTAGVCTASDSVAPVALIGCTHAGYLVVANDSNTLRNRLWFSPIPNPETTWDTSNAYIDTAAPITGLASIQGVLLVFHAGSIERIIGSIPPGTIGENMSLQPLSGQAGCLDAGSLAPVGGNLYFADSSGVWITNGASVTSISERSDATGISSLWRTAVSYGPAHGLFRAVRGGTFGDDYYMVAIMEGTGVGEDWTNRLFLVYHVATGAWARFQINAIGSFASSGVTLETYAASTRTPHLLTLSDLFADVPAYIVDEPSGVAVMPTVTSRVLGGGPFEKAFGDGHLTYDMRTDYGATLVLTLSKDIEQQTFQPSFTFAGVSGPTRQRYPISGDGHGLTFRIAQTNASTRTELYAVEVEHRNYEEQADG